MTKLERPQEIALAAVKPFTHAAYLGLVSAVVDAGGLVDNYDKYGCTSLIETLNSKKWNQEQNILLMSSLNVLLLLVMKN